jgi:hypothetical protein
MHKNINRRDFLALSAAATLLPPSLVAAKWKKIPVATQAWCVRKQMKDDIPGTLKAVAQLGYDGIELENAFGKSGAEWRKHLDAAKLKAWYLFSVNVRFMVVDGRLRL